MFERFSRDARSVVVSAHTEAAALGHDSIGPEHLFLGLLEQTDGAGFAVLSEAGLDAAGVRRVVLARRPGRGRRSRSRCRSSSGCRATTRAPPRSSSYRRASSPFR